MSGEETFEFAAAVAGVSIGLAATLILAVLAIVGTWRLFRHASEASLVSARAALGVEELARRLSGEAMPAARMADAGHFAQLRRQAEALSEQQRRLQELSRDLLDSAALEAGAAPAALEDLEQAVGRLDGTVGEMAAALANLIQLLERRGEG